MKFLVASFFAFWLPGPHIRDEVSRLYKRRVVDYLHAELARIEAEHAALVIKDQVAMLDRMVSALDSGQSPGYNATITAPDIETS